MLFELQSQGFARLPVSYGIGTVLGGQSGAAENESRQNGAGEGERFHGMFSWRWV